MNLKKGYVSMYKPKINIPKISWLADNQFAIATIALSLISAAAIYIAILLIIYLTKAI